MSTSYETALSFCEVTSSGVLTRSWNGNNLDSLIDLALGQTLAGRYVLVSELGSGGMGRVYLARDPLLGRDVALKVSLATAPRNLLSPPNLVEEGQLAALVNHPSIASVYDSGMHNGKPFTIFEYVDGSNLRDVMRQRPPQWPVEDVASVLRTLAEALDYAHARGVIHSDLKPENICLASSGLPKVLDFGMATRVNAGVRSERFMGTPAYASPEQAQCKVLDGRSDQYSLANVIFELLCGRRVFLQPDAIGVLRAHAYDVPPSVAEFRNDLPADTVAAIGRALSKDPKDRFPTCRDFAAAFAAAILDRRDGAAFEQRTDIHITATQTESLVAKLLATALESSGYRAWYYQRDALPGIPLNRQVRESMRATRAALLLISRSSMSSKAFAEEVIEANQLGRPFLPILIDMSLQEFEEHPPAWRAALGSATIVEYRRSQLESVLQRLHRSLQLLEVFPSESAAPNQRIKATEARKSSATQTWATDSNQIESRDLQRVVFRNQVIENYLSRPNKYFLSATKGLGKTMLMKFKRHLMTSDVDGQRVGCLIPSGQPFLDFMSEMKLLSKNYDAQLSDLSFCKRLWGAALRISILSHHADLIPPSQHFELKAFPQRIQHWLQGATVEPTVAFKELTNLPVGDVNRLIDNTENFLDKQVRSVHASTMVFIDKVDQAVRHLSRGSWINIQAGLIEAAWDLMSANSHIKVFASIRQEAFANFQSDIKANLLGATTMLRYSEDELRSLMDHLTACYEGVDGFQTFVGVNVIKHPTRPFPEDSFEFLKRFTFGRPRDFVAIAAELSTSKDSLDERRYCEVIRQTSSLALVPSLFDENKVFLDCLFNRDNQAHFLDLLRSNIMTREQAISISRQFNGMPEVESCDFDEESSEIFHPFRDLFLTGLLGVVKRNDQDVHYQRFRQPDDALSTSRGDLPNSSHYFIHPALSEYIQQSRSSSHYRIIQQILVGENAPWHPFDPIIFQIELALEGVADLEMRGLVQEMLGEAKVAKLSANPRSLRAEMDSSKKWRELVRGSSRGGYDDVVLWFDELMNL